MSETKHTSVDMRPLEPGCLSKLERRSMACMLACKGVDFPEPGELARLRANRDELLQACKQTLRLLGGPSFSGSEDFISELAKIITRAEGRSA